MTNRRCPHSQLYSSVILATMLVLTPPSFGGDCNATVSIGSLSVQPGSTSNPIVVAISNDQPIRGVELDVVDTPDILTASGCESLIAGFNCNFLDNNGVAAIIFVSETGATLPVGSDAPLFRLLYDVDPDATIGTVVLEPRNTIVPAATSQQCSAVGEPGTLSLASTQVQENERRVADVLPVVCADATDDLGDRCSELADLQLNDPAEFERALDAITPEEVAAQTTSVVEVSTTQLNNVRTRLSTLRSGTAGGSLTGFTLGIDGGTLPVGAIANAMQQDADSDQWSDDSLVHSQRLGLFVNGRLSFGEKDRTANETGFDYDGHGVTVGLDYRIKPTLVLGGALGFGETSMEFVGAGGALDVEIWTLSGYGSWYPTPRGYIDWIVSYGASELDTTRNIVFGMTNTTAIGATDGAQLAVSASGGIDFNKQAWSFSPYYRIDYQTVDIDAYGETGGAGLGLSFSDQSVDSLIAAAATNVTRVLSRSWGVVVPGLRFEWEHEFDDDGRLLTSEFVEATVAQSFDVIVDDPDRDSFNVGLNVATTFRGGMSAFLDFETKLGLDDVTAQFVRFGFRKQF